MLNPKDCRSVLNLWLTDQAIKYTVHYVNLLHSPVICTKVSSRLILSSTHNKHFYLKYTFSIFYTVVSSQRNRRYTCRYDQEGLPVDGPCGEQCICLEGRLEYCCRKRKNFPSMTRTERLRYVNTVIKASTDRRYRRKYNQLISIHSGLFNRGIHDKQEFLPWHRW